MCAQAGTGYAFGVVSGSWPASGVCARGARPLTALLSLSSCLLSPQYSPQLKTALDYTQSELDLVAFMGNLGTYTCFVGGLIFDRYGPKAAGAFGVSLSLLGYALLWAGASKHIPHTPFLIGLYQFIWSYGSSAVDITAVSVTIRNFPLNCGSMVGLLKVGGGVEFSV